MSNFAFYLISFLGAIQGSLIGFIVFLRKAYWSNIFIASFIFLFSIGLLEPFLQDVLDEQNVLLIFLKFSNFLYGPLIFLYISSLYKEISKHDIVFHLSPFIILFLTETSLSFWIGQSIAEGSVLIILFEILVVQMLGYSLISLRRLGVNTEIILKQKKAFSKNDISWLKYFLVFLICIYSISFIVSNLSLLGFSEFEIIHRFNQLLMIVVVYALGYKILVKPDFLLFQKKHKIIEYKPEKYSRSGLTESKASEYLELLEKYMLSQKPFLNADLSIHELADQLGISKHYLTQVLNEKSGKNFYEYINCYRVEEVKNLMTNPLFSNFNLPALGLQAGFKSKTAFNINFKKSTGLPPSEWKKRFVDKNGQSAPV
jgi:AraC-like DNA-binding protein